MSGKEFFPPRPASWPTIYAYEDTNPRYAGLLKVGCGAHGRGLSAIFENALEIP